MPPPPRSDPSAVSFYLLRSTSFQRALCTLISSLPLRCRDLGRLELVQKLLSLVPSESLRSRRLFPPVFVSSRKIFSSNRLDLATERSSFLSSLHRGQTSKMCRTVMFPSRHSHADATPSTYRSLRSLQRFVEPSFPVRSCVNSAL